MEVVRSVGLIRDLEGSPAEQVARDLELFDRVAAGFAPDTVRVWRTAPCIVVPRRDALSPTFDVAAAACAALGWPVVIRESGGSAFPIGPATVQVSVVRSTGPGRAPSAGALYRQLCEPIVSALLESGVPATVESTPGSMCDGTHNICVDGRKLAGTAQRQRRLPDGSTLVLLNAALAVGGPWEPAVAAVQRFCRLLGRPDQYDSACHTYLMECMPDAIGGELAAWSDWALRWLEDVFVRSHNREAGGHDRGTTEAAC